MLKEGMFSRERDEYGRTVPLMENLWGTRRIGKLDKKWMVNKEPLQPSEVEVLKEDAQKRMKLCQTAVKIGFCTILVGIASRDTNLFPIVQAGILLSMLETYRGMLFQEKLTALEKFEKPKEK
jgi:hypothetical protein